MEPDKTQDPQLTGYPPLPTFWGDIRHFFIGLPDRWDLDKRSAYVDRSADRPGGITEEEELPTLSGLIRSFFCDSYFDSAAEMISDPTSLDGYMLGVGPFSEDNKMDDG
jgi:hypothetical protein